LRIGAPGFWAKLRPKVFSLPHPGGEKNRSDQTFLKGQTSQVSFKYIFINFMIMGYLTRFRLAIPGARLGTQHRGWKGEHFRRKINNFSIDIYACKGFYCLAWRILPFRRRKNVSIANLEHFCIFGGCVP
jgi:hypothetical protein